MNNWYKQNINTEFKRYLIEKWNALLAKNHTEKEYHNFLFDNAGLFLANENCHLVISKLKLGSELETDFVTLTDGFSNENQFELIEIKQPNTKLFTAKGVMTSEFNRAIQQIRDWKRWLMTNKSWVKKHLPTHEIITPTQDNLKFKIIIGRRLINPYEIEKRNQISQEIGAEIRSFDYLTDKIKSRVFYPVGWLSDANEYWEEEIANPFFKAMTDSDWKKFCKSGHIAIAHFYSQHYKKIIESRTYNSLMTKFNNEYNV